MDVGLVVKMAIANNQKHYEMFDVLADAYEKANGKQIQSDYP